MSEIEKGNFSEHSITSEEFQEKMKGDEKLENQKMPDVVQKETPEEVTGKIADAKSKLESTEGMSGPKDLEEFAKALTGDSYEFYEVYEGSLGENFLKLLEEVKTIQAIEGNKAALEKALDEFSKLDFDYVKREDVPEVLSRGEKLFRAEYGAPDTEEQVARRARRTEIQKAIEKVYADSTLVIPHKYAEVTYDNFGDYAGALRQTKEWLDLSERQLKDDETFLERYPSWFKQIFTGERYLPKSIFKERIEKLKRDIPKIKILVVELQKIPEKIG